MSVAADHSDGRPSEHYRWLVSSKNFKIDTGASSWRSILIGRLLGSWPVSQVDHRHHRRLDRDDSDRPHRKRSSADDWVGLEDSSFDPELP